MEIDITKYAPVISGILTRLKIKKQDREDMTQECYLALLEKHKHLERGIELGTDASFAASICRSRIADIWKRDNQYRTSHKTKPEIRFDSLSDPRIYRKAAKIGEPVGNPNSEATSGELEDAVLSLPFEEFRVIHELFVECKTQEQVAKELGVSVSTIAKRSQRGIEMMKEYFEVSDGVV